MADICQGMEWRFSLSTLAICISINWSPQQTTDGELYAERSHQNVKSNDPAELNVAIPLETVADISELASEMARLEELHTQTAKSVEVQSLCF